MRGSQLVSAHGTKFVNRALRQVQPGHQTRSCGRKTSDPLSVLGAEYINLVNPIFKVTKPFNPTGKSNKNWIVRLMSVNLAAGIW